MPLILLALLAAAAGASKTAPPDCDALYYGVGQAKDRKAAYACYTVQGDYPMRLVMLMNGEGVPIDLAKAQAVLGEWERADRWNATESLQAEALRKALAERQARPDQPFARLDFCADVAGDTINVDHCAAVEQRLAQQGATDELAQIRGKLTPGAAQALDALAKAFEAFKAAEGKRAYQEYSEGSIRNVAAMTQEQTVAAHFMKDVRTVAGARQLGTATAESYQAADAALGRTYEGTLTSYAAAYDQLQRDPTLKAQWDEYRQLVATYRQIAGEAQQAWSRYRDAWVPLTQALFGGDPGRRAAILRLVTEDRDDELTNDPVGGE